VVGAQDRGTEVPQWDPGPGRGSGGQSLEKLKQNVKLVYIFLRFPVKKL